MFITTHLTTHQIQATELHRKAEEIRLARRIEKSSPLARKLAASAGQILIQSGEQLISRSQNTG